jgi:hypothetical protein
MSMCDENSDPENDETTDMDDRIKTLRVKIWFSAVKFHSKLNNNDLSRMFPSTKRKSSKTDASNGSMYSPNESGYWDQIRRGEIMPLLREHGKQLVKNVDETFPGTKRWIESPLWVLLRTKPMTIDEIYSILESLHSRITESLLVKSSVGSTFARNPLLKEQYERLDRIARPLFPSDDDDVFGRLMGGVIAVVALIREAEITQQQPQHFQGRIVWKKMVDRLDHFAEIRPFLEELKMIGISRFKGTVYSPDGEGGFHLDIL